MRQTISTVSTDTFADHAQRSDHAILDIRPIAAYNGWPLNGAARGGHVPGAKSLPHAWTQYMDWVEVPEDKTMNPAAPLTIYGDTATQVDDMAE